MPPSPGRDSGKIAPSNASGAKWDIWWNRARRSDPALFGSRILVKEMDYAHDFLLEFGTALVWTGLWITVQPSVRHVRHASLGYGVCGDLGRRKLL
jgi:hypothetical protein